GVPRPQPGQAPRHHAFERPDRWPQRLGSGRGASPRFPVLRYWPAGACPPSYAGGPGLVRVLVTGGAGFIGSSLCRALLADGHSVLAVDNLITGRHRNIEELLDQPAFSFLEESTQFMPEVDVDAVFHLASPASPVG